MRRRPTGRTIAVFAGAGLGLALALGVTARAQGVKPATPKPPLPKAAQAARLVDQAESLQAQNKLAEAAKLFQQAADLTPEDWGLWDRAGWAWLEAAQAALAVKAFQAEAKAAPPSSAPPGGLLIAQFAANDARAVEALLKKLLAPDTLAVTQPIVARGLAARQFTPDWSYALGYLYHRVLRNSQRALGPLEAVAKAVPTRADVWLLLVEVNQDLNRDAQEEAAALKYLALAPMSPDAYRIKAQKFALAQNYEAAIKEYEDGIAKHPGAVELFFPLARAYERAGNTKQAEATYGKLIAAAESRKLEAVGIQARLQLGQLLARKKDYAGAEKLYRDLAAQPDATPATTENWAALLALGGQWEPAAAAYRSACDRTDRSGAAAEDRLAARCRAAVAALATGKRDDAGAQIQLGQGLMLEVRTSAEAELLAFAAWLSGGKDDALAYRRGDERWSPFVWRSKPEDGEFEVRGRFSIAATGWRALLQQAQKRYPDSWPADYALAREYAAGGATPEALALLARSIKARPGWWAPQYALGQYYARERDREKGLPVLRKVLELAPECRGARVYLSLLTNLKPEDE